MCLWLLVNKKVVKHGWLYIIATIEPLLGVKSFVKTVYFWQNEIWLNCVNYIGAFERHVFPCCGCVNSV